MSESWPRDLDALFWVFKTEKQGYFSNVETKIEMLIRLITVKSRISLLNRLKLKLQVRQVLQE